MSFTGVGARQIDCRVLLTGCRESSLLACGRSLHVLCHVAVFAGVGTFGNLARCAAGTLLLEGAAQAVSGASVCLPSLALACAHGVAASGIACYDRGCMGLNRRCVRWPTASIVSCWCWGGRWLTLLRGLEAVCSGCCLAAVLYATAPSA